MYFDLARCKNYLARCKLTKSRRATTYDDIIVTSKTKCALDCDDIGTSQNQGRPLFGITFVGNCMKMKKKLDGLSSPPPFIRHFIDRTNTSRTSTPSPTHPYPPIFLKLTWSVDCLVYPPRYSCVPLLH